MMKLYEEETAVEAFCQRWGAKLSYKESVPDWLRYTIRGTLSERSMNGRVDALRLLFHGRWGNYVIELINMFHIAEYLGIDKIYIYPTDLFLFSSGEEVGGIKIFYSQTDDPEGETSLTGNYFDHSEFGAITEGLDAARRGQLATKYVRPLLAHLNQPSAVIKADDLAIHIRSGDIFQGDDGAGGSAYGGALLPQPPLSFYLKAVERAFTDRKGRIFILAENALNPVILELVKSLDKTGYSVTLRINQSLADDLAWLMSAKKLIIASGTFGMGLLMLSSNIETAYIFRKDGSGTTLDVGAFIPPHVNSVFVLDKTGSYIFKGSWLNTAAQRQEMIAFPASNLVWEDGHP